jgi:hypothetical protein
MAKDPIKKKKAPSKKAPSKKAPAKKSSSGTFTEKMGEAKARPNKGLPARIEKPRGNSNKANPPKEIRLGGQGGTGRSVVKPGSAPKAFKPFPLGSSPKLLGSAGAVARAGAGFAATRALQMATGPVGFLVGMTTEAGKGSDKPSGKLFSPSQNRAAGKGNPKTVNRYGKTTVASRPEVPGSYAKGKAKTVNPYKVFSGIIGGGGIQSYNTDRSKGFSNTPLTATNAKILARGEARDGMKSTLESYRASKVVAPKPKARPDNLRPVAPKPKARPSVAAPAKEMTLQTATRRNETEAYIRNKMKPKSNLLDLIRNKKKK